MIVVERKGKGQNVPKLASTLYFYSLAVSTLSTITHYISDGILSIALLSSVVFSTVLHYKSININLYENHINLRRNHLQTSFKIFSTTILAVLRVAFISISDSSIFSLYLAYLSLFIAFTDNLQHMSEAEMYKPISTYEYSPPIQQRIRNFDMNAIEWAQWERRPRRCPRYAPAG